jgi:HlyD family secretion protein
MSRWIIGIVAVVVLLVVAWAALAMVNGGVSVQAAKVARGPIREIVDEQAKTRLPIDYKITMPFAGRIEDIELEEGAEVESGQVVAQIAPKDLDYEVDEAQAAVDRLAASIIESQDTSVEEGMRQQALKFVESMAKTVAAAENRKIAGEKQVEVAARKLANTQEIFQSKTGGVTQEKVDEDDLRHVEAQVDFRQDILVAESIKAIEAATLLMPQMVADYITRKGLQTTVLDKEKSEAQARLEQALLSRERGTMKSPVDGIVLERLITHEQYLPAGEVLVRIGDLRKMEVEADVLSEDATAVRPGQAVEIYGPGVGASGLVRGSVERVYPAGFTKLSSLGVEQQRVKVIVRLEPAALDELLEAKVGVDYRVRVRIFTAASENALVVPRSAIFRSPDGGWQVFAATGGRARLTPVEVGLMNDDAAEIKSGLAEGDLVVLAPETSLTEGARVKAVVRE